MLQIVFSSYFVKCLFPPDIRRKNNMPIFTFFDPLPLEKLSYAPAVESISNTESRNIIDKDLETISH